MLSLSPATRVLAACQPVDGRLAFNGLYALVRDRLQADPLSGHLFLFTNRRRNRLKVLYWDGTGLWLCTKRLERGTLGWPQGPKVSVALRPEEWAGLVQGVELRPRRGWYRSDPEKSGPKAAK